MPASKVCSRPGCPHKATQRGKCDQHARADDQARGTSTERGYTAEHRAIRRAWEPKVAAGGVRCARCHQPIHPGTPWDLGHDDNDRTKYRGPEHAGQCNRSAGGRAAHGLPPKPPGTAFTQRDDHPG